MTGLIISGALWDLRKALVTELGTTAGVNLADDVFYGVISRADDIPSSYAEALVTDDDDGNLANGTPHKCAIDRAFGAHGLGELAVATQGAKPSFDVATRTVRLEQLDASGTASCPGPQITKVSATWRLRSAPDTTQSLDLAADGTGFAAQFPAVADGEVLQYQLEATLDDGATLRLPKNPVDRWYEAYFGPVKELYCTDFESDPVTDGWTLTGFQWGAPTGGTGSSDPSEAFSGMKLIGTVLTGDGSYPTMSTAKAMSPAIDVAADAKAVRLQYRRWLSTEDAVYDKATISVDSMELWKNFETQEGGADHIDGEWRFHDVDITPAASDGKVQISFGLEADDYIEYGGWNIDKLCVVAVLAPGCGNGVVDSGETCDDGNTANGDGCSSTCTKEDGTGGEDDGGGCCSSSGAPAGSFLLALFTLGVTVRRRRRR
jgi:cysteine-rich repeat protein